MYYYPETAKQLILLVCAIFVIPVVIALTAVLFLNDFWLQYLWIIRVLGTTIIVLNWGRVIGVKNYEGYAYLIFYLLVLLERVPLLFK